VAVRLGPVRPRGGQEKEKQYILIYYCAEKTIDPVTSVAEFLSRSPGQGEKKAKIRKK